MTWAAVAAAGGTIIGGALSAKGAKDAAKASGQAAAGGIAETRRQFDTLMGLNQPTINAGNAARAQLAAILGLDVPATGYSNNGAGIGRPAGPVGRDLDKRQKTFLTVHNPTRAVLGAFGVESPGQKLITKVLGRTHSSDRPIASSDLQGLLERVRSNPLDYDTTAETKALINRQRPGAQLQVYNALKKNDLGSFGEMPVAETTAPMSNDDIMTRLEQYPGFQFAVEQARKASGAQASAMGASPLGGNALTALQKDVAGNVAMPAFNDYMNRLSLMSGGGTTTAQAAGTSAMQAGSDIARLLESQGDARASGILGRTQAGVDTIGNLSGLLGWYAARQNP